MRQTMIDWKSGHVDSWSMESIDLDRPLLEQVSELSEDLAQISYPGGLVIDVGWYPEFSDQGTFVVSVVGEEGWDAPVFSEKCSSATALLTALRNAVDFVQHRREDI